MIKTVTLTGSEVKVSDLGGQNVAVKNLGDSAIYASRFPNVVAGADNVVEIPAGGGEVVLDAQGTVYLLGTGKVQCTGTPYATPNFKMPSLSTSGGGGRTDNGVIGGTFTIASMDDDPDIMHIEGVPNDPNSIAEAISDLTDLSVVTPTSGYFSGQALLTIDDVGLYFGRNYVTLACKSDDDWICPLTTNIQTSSDNNRPRNVDIYVKKDLIAIGIYDDTTTQRCLTCIFAQDTDGVWYTVVPRYPSYYDIAIVSPKNPVLACWHIGSNITVANYINNNYTPDPTVWLSRCPTYVYNNKASFKSLYLMHTCLWSSNIVNKLFFDTELVGSEETFMSVGKSAISSSPNKIFIRK